MKIKKMTLEILGVLFAVLGVALALPASRLDSNTLIWGAAIAALFGAISALTGLKSEEPREPDERDSWLDRHHRDRHNSDHA